MIERRYATTQFVLLYPVDDPLPPELVTFGKRVITQGVLTNRHYLLPDQPGAAVTWLHHARNVKLATRFGLTATPQGTSDTHDYYRLVFARTLAERDMVLFGMADVIHLFGPSRDTRRLFERVQQLGKHVLWHDGYTTVESKTPA